MAGLMDVFFGSGAKHAPAPNTSVPTQGNIPQGTGVAAPASATTAPNGTNPTNGPAAGTQTEDQNKSPLDAFSKLWEAPTNDKGEVITPTNTPLFNVDSKSVMEAAQKIDFKSVANPDQLAKIVAGGQEGVAAMMEIMNTMSQHVYANAAVAATKIAESGITRALSQAEQRLPGKIRDQQITEGLASKNPALLDPAVRPMVDMMRAQFSQKYPNATAAELQSMAEDYLTKVGDVFNPAKQVQAQKDQQRQNDQANEWDKFFDTGSSGLSF